MGLPAHMERVVAERNDLRDRNDKLKAFFGNAIFEALSSEEQAAMREQSSVMTQYEDILNGRIARAGGEF